MDVLAHSLWTNLMYRSLPPTKNNKKVVWWGIAFGVIPDLVSFTPIFIAFAQALITGSASFGGGRPDFPQGVFAHYAATSYNYTHSFVIFLIAAVLLWIVLRKFPWVILGWGLHIFIDIFSHTKEFYATPFLFPLSDFKVSVFSWGHPIFMSVNYTALILVYIFLIPRVTKRNVS